MKYREFGRTGMKVSEIGYGGWGIGGRGWGPTDDDETTRSLRRAIDLGVNFFDTALGYGNGHSEKILGKALKKVRDKVFIATKIPPKAGRWPVLNESISVTFPADWIVECTEKSLRNLNTDYIDIQQLHAWTDAYNQQLEWYEALMRLKKQGKVRFFGVSANDWDPYGTVNLVKSERVDSIQVIYNIFEQRPAEKLFPAALEHKVGIIARVPFEEGLLTGKLGPDYVFAKGDWRAEWLTPKRLREAAQRVERLKEFLTPDRPTLALLALKFCLGHPAVCTVIPGMRKMRHVEENCAVSDGKVFSKKELEELSKHSFIHGWKYPWSQEKKNAPVT